MSKILDTLEEWKLREPRQIGCVVVGKGEIQDLIDYIFGKENLMKSADKTGNSEEGK